MKVRRWMLLVALLASIATVSRFSAIYTQGQVTSGTINQSFPSDFPTARTYYAYPLSYYPYSQSSTSYLLEGQAAPVNVRFESYPNYGNTSTGSVTLIASSDAFVNDVNSTMDINVTYQFFTFTLRPTIKSGIDGTYSVDYRAINELSMQVAEQSNSITVWSTTHEEAADSLYTLSSLIGYYPYGIGYYGPKYESGQAKSNMTLATIEYSLAALAYNNADWNGTKTHAQNATDLIKKADSAEAASSLPDKTAYLVQVVTYPLLIIAVLIIVYVAAATYRKIYPSPKTAKASQTLLFESSSKTFASSVHRSNTLV